MDTLQFNKLLLRTAFASMACDGEIEKREVKLIRKLHTENKTFGDVNIDEELDKLLAEINKDGQQFLKDFFSKLKRAELTESDELNLIEVAIEIIKADDKIEYNEIKFFKVIRSNLKINNDSILEIYPELENYLEQDVISNSYMSRLQNDFLDTLISNEFVFDENVLL
ncbi:MAG: TerB family tellurite resistance protein [Mangrovibacterium sp.]